MKMPITDTIDIFFIENTLYILFYAVYAVIVCGIILYLEYNGQQTDVFLGKLIFSNGTQWILAVILMTVSLYVGGWLPKLFLNEIFTVLVMLTVSFGPLYALKKFFISYLDLQLVSPTLMCVMSSIILLLPYTLFSLFLFALASADWRN